MSIRKRNVTHSYLFLKFGGKYFKTMDLTNFLYIPKPFERKNRERIQHIMMVC